MLESSEAEKFAQVAQQVEPHSTLLRTWELQGGVSAQVTALELARPDGRTRKLVVRQHGAVDREHNPQIAADEFKLLQLLQSVGVAAPAPLYLDQSGAIFATPYIVLEYVEGQPEFAPANLPDFLLQFATQLARIHQIQCADLDLSFLPKQETRHAATLSTRPIQMDESLDEGRIRDALEAGWPLPQRNEAVLLHGDFWPGNILWREGKLVAVLDWEDAQTGDPLADVANSRLEILWAFGNEAMRQFTRHYQALAALDYTDLPYWDLWAALRPAGKIGAWGLDAGTEQRMRESHRWFITQAFQ